MSSESIWDTVIKVGEKELTVALKDSTEGLYVKLSEKTGNSRRIVLSVPLAGLEDFKRAIGDAQKASKGQKSTLANGGGAVAAPAAKPARQPRAPREPREQTVNHSEPEVVSRSVYVAGLSWETTADQLKTHFKRMGAILNSTILVRRRGKEIVSRGCGVLEFKSAAEAQRCIREMSETELDGRTIKCREDRGDIAKDSRDAGAVETAPAAAEKASKPKRERKPRVAESDKKLEPNMVFLSNVAYITTSETLSNFMTAFGEVRSCEILTAKSGRSLGHAVVEFSRQSAAKEAIERVNGKELDGRALEAKEYYSHK